MVILGVHEEAPAEVERMYQAQFGKDTELTVRMAITILLLGLLYGAFIFALLLCDVYQRVTGNPPTCGAARSDRDDRPLTGGYIELLEAGIRPLNFLSPTSSVEHLARKAVKPYLKVQPYMTPPAS